MKHIERKALEEQLAICKRIAGKKSHIPICNTVKLTMTRQAVVMHVTDLENMYLVGIPYDGMWPFRTFQGKPKFTGKCFGPSLCVSISKLMRAVKAVPKGIKSISLEILEDYIMKINGTLSIIGMEPEDFPSLPKIPIGGWHKALDIEAMYSIQGAMLLDEGRPQLQGIYFNFDQAEMVATDGHRLHLTSLKESRVENFILSGNAVKFLWATRKQVTPWLAVDNINVYIQTDYGIFVSRKVKGDFPDYKQIIPDQCNEYLMIEKQKFTDIINEAKAILDGNHEAVTLDLSSRVIIRTENPEIGSFEKRFSGRFVYQGQKLVVPFNAEYLLGTIAPIPDKMLMIQFQGNTGCAILDSMDADFRAVIMPMRINVVID